MATTTTPAHVTTKPRSRKRVSNKEKQPTLAFDDTSCAPAAAAPEPEFEPELAGAPEPELEPELAGARESNVEPECASDSEPEPEPELEHEPEPEPAQKPACELDDKEIGALGEKLAQQFLIKNNYRLCKTNWRTPYGEADIVAMDGDTCVFVEVKTRNAMGGRITMFPELAVDEKKQERYINMARLWSRERPEVLTYRFDVIAILIVEEHLAKLRHLQNAFEMSNE